LSAGLDTTPDSRPIGIFGGTFDPVHFGHLRPALELKEELGLERVHLIPCNIPPHRGEPHASAEQRCAMLQLAINDEPDMVLDRRELERPGPSYMVDTLKSLREEYGGERPLCLIIGGDAFLGLPSWYHWQELIQLAHIVVAHRPGWKLDEATLDAPLATLLQQQRLNGAEQLCSSPAGGVLLQTVTQLDISATAIRSLVSAGGSANYLLPQPVWDYIRQHNLYRSV
jgi:nicotinate-nucleotide adenylyltransferase